MKIEDDCPICNSTRENICYDEKDCVVYCGVCGTVLAATISYVGGDLIWLPWGLL